MSSGPNAAPQGADETIVLKGSFIAGGRRLPMGNGWAWIAAAWSVFRRAAGLWIGMSLVLFVIFLILALCVVYGVFAFAASIVMALLFPIFAAGLAMVSRTIDQGGDPKFKQLFAGFRHRVGALLAVGAAFLVANVIITAVVFGLFGLDLSTIGKDAAPDVLMALVARLAIAGLLVLALTLPFVMAIWFAPALLAFEELGPAQAMKQSFLGCLKNVLPFLLYGVILLVAGAVASVPALLGWLVLGPVMAASVYTSYRDIYFSDSAG